MKRKIMWNSGVLEEIELVYEKASENERIGKLLEQLENQALTEAKNNVGMLKTSGGTTLSPDQFDALADGDKETVIKVLGDYGFAGGKTDIAAATIIFTLSPHVSQLQACTIFSILNRLEKLNGIFNEVISSKTTLELQVPLGGKKGLLQWEMLIMQLYPWLSVKETSTNETAAEKQKNSGTFMNEMQEKEAFRVGIEKAKTELGEVIRDGKFSLKYQNTPLSYNDWTRLNELQKLNYVISMGNYGISVKTVVCVDFAEIIPYCIATALLYGAWSGQLEKQMIDAGDGSDPTKLVEALSQFYSCCSTWECTVAHPVFVKIPGSISEGKSSEPENKPEKEIILGKSVWKIKG